MPPQIHASHLVRLTAQQRLDLVDLLAIPELIDSYVQRALGGVLGPLEGCVTPFRAEFGNSGGVYKATFEAFTFAHSDRASTRLQPGAPGIVQQSVGSGWHLRVVNYDPSEQQLGTFAEYQTARTAARNEGSLTPSDPVAVPFLWARPIAVDTDVKTCRRWSAGAEVQFNQPTRTKIEARFKFSSVKPSANGGAEWIVIGRIRKWLPDENGDPDVPVVEARSCWDHQRWADLTNQDDAWVTHSEPNSSMYQVLDTLYSGNGVQSLELGDEGANLAYSLTHRDRDLGVGTVLALLRDRMRRILCLGKSDDQTIVDTGQTSWIEPPKYSLAEVARQLDGLTGDVDTLQGQDIALTTAIGDLQGEIDNGPVTCSAVLKYDESTGTWSIVRSTLFSHVEKAIDAQAGGGLGPGDIYLFFDKAKIHEWDQRHVIAVHGSARFMDGARLVAPVVRWNQRNAAGNAGGETTGPLNGAAFMRGAEPAIQLAVTPHYDLADLTDNFARPAAADPASNVLIYVTVVLDKVAG